VNTCVATLILFAASSNAAMWDTTSQVKLENVMDVSSSADDMFVTYTVGSVTGSASPNFASTTMVMVQSTSTSDSTTTKMTQFPGFSSPKFSPKSKSLAMMANATVFVSSYDMTKGWGNPMPVSSLMSEGAMLHAEWSPDSSKLAISVTPPATPVDAIAREIGSDIIIDTITGTPNAPNNKLCVVDLSSSDMVSTAGFKCVDTLGSVGFTNWHISCWPYDSQFKWSPNGNDVVYTYAVDQFSNDWTQTGVAVLKDVMSASPTSTSIGYNTTFQPMYNEDGSLLAFAKTDDGDYIWAQTWHMCVMITSSGEIKCDPNGTMDQMPTFYGFAGNKLMYGEQKSVDMGIYSKTISAGGDFGQWQRVSLDFAGPGVVGGGFRSTSLVSVTKMDQGSTFKLGFSYEETTLGQQAYIASLSSTGVEVKKISNINSNVDHEFIKPKVVTWKSSDGLEVEGILTMPTAAADGSLPPLVVFTHCGPAMSVMATYVGYGSVCARFPLASLAEAGFAVLQPNYRGSIGYGKAFRRSDQNDWGGSDYDDVMTGALSLISTGTVDKDRVAHIGWSYGGYMSALAMGTAKTRHGIDFKAFVTGGTLSDLISHTGTTDISKIIKSWAGGYFFDDNSKRLGMMMENSGIYHIANASAPTLMFHGIDDPRMPISQSFQLHYALQQQGIPVKFLTFPGSGHIPGNQNQIIRVWDETISWLTKYLITNAK